jgi:hypothetical protein
MPQKPCCLTDKSVSEINQGALGWRVNTRKAKDSHNSGIIILAVDKDRRTSSATFLYHK